MPFRATFECLWCGAPHACRGPDDLEGWAGSVRPAWARPVTTGSSGSGSARRIEERGRAGRGGAMRRLRRAGSATIRHAVAVPRDAEAALIPYYEARAAEYDDWYLRRGRYARGPIHDAAWNAELDAAGRWLDGLPIRGEIVDLAAGTGWWSTLLAGKGELSLYDANAAPLERARDRLLAHGLRAHLHVRDAWAEPDRAVDVVFTELLAQSRPARQACRLPRARRSLAQAGRPVRLHRFAARPAVVGRGPSDAIRRPFGPPARRRPRVHDREGLLLAGRARNGTRGRGLPAAAVTTTGRFFLLGGGVLPD